MNKLEALAWSLWTDTKEAVNRGYSEEGESLVMRELGRKKGRSRTHEMSVPDIAGWA